MKILIVDDCSADRKYLRRNLEHHECKEIMEAADGQEGLEKAKAYRPDLIISDALMPVMDGFQFLREIKKDKTLANIPFVFYSSADTGYKEAELATSLEAAAFVLKPKDPEEFWEELIGVLEECKLKRENALPPAVLKEEEEFLGKYSHIVSAKLEEKVAELEKEIAAHKKTEERLRSSEEFIKNILESVDEGFIVIDPEYRIISANRAYCEQMKALNCDLIGKHCYEVSHHINKPCFMVGEECASKQTFKTGVPHRVIHTHYDREGKPIYIEEKSFPMTDASGKIYAVIETLNNITEKRSLEGQLRHAQKMEAIGTLAGGIAHDFNNMLNVIVGYAALMQMRMKQDDAMYPQVKEILATVDRAARLTRGLLAFSRKQVMEIRTVNLNEVVTGFKKMLARIIGEDIELSIVTADEDLTARVDMGQIEQVLMNLVVNSRDAMPRGGVITIGTRPVKIDREFIKTHGYGEPGLYALITVSDTGIGMDRKTRERIFEPFFTTKDMGRGTGLGLAIVYGIVTQHKGYLNCFSEPGKGTTFRIFIPLDKSAAEKLEKEETHAPEGGTETILVAEDDANVRGLIKIILEGFGYTVIEAVDGHDAVRKFRDNKDNIRLFLTDLIMPGKTGKDAYEDIKGARDDIRVIFISGYARDIIHKYGIEEGIEFISKPILPNELLRKVREELDKKSEQYW